MKSRRMTKNSMEFDDDFLGMNIFDKLMEGKISTMKL
jgi:hypothetical protein